MTIHKAGYTNIALCILLIFLVNAIIQFYTPQAHLFKWFVYILSLAFFVATLWFFRNPVIEVGANDKAVLSPADGMITGITEVEETGSSKSRYIKVSIAIALTDVRVTRSPVSGTVKQVQTDGHATVSIQSNAGATLLYRQLPGYTKHIVTQAQQGKAIKQGDELGFAMGGSNVEVLLPAGTTVKVEVNDTVKGGQTVLAQFRS